MLSIRWSGNRKPHCRDFLEVECHEFMVVAFENPIARTLLRSNVIESGQWQSSKNNWQDFLEVQCHELRAVAFENPLPGLCQVQCQRFWAVIGENPIGETFSKFNVINSGWWQSETPLAGLSRGPLSSIQGSGTRKPLCWDFFEIQCHQFMAVAFENPIAGTLSMSNVIELGQWQLKTPLLGLCRSPVSSIWGTSCRKPLWGNFSSSNVIIAG